MGLHRARGPDENPASNTAARVSLPLTMSNILQKPAFSANSACIRRGRVGRSVCSEARGIGPSPLSRQPPFSNFFQRPEGDRKTRKKNRRSLPRAHCGARDQDPQVGGRRRYTPGLLATQELFGWKCVKYAFSTGLPRLPAEPWIQGVFGHGLIAGRRPACPDSRFSRNCRSACRNDMPQAV